MDRPSPTQRPTLLARRVANRIIKLSYDGCCITVTESVKRVLPRFRELSDYILRRTELKNTLGRNISAGLSWILGKKNRTLHSGPTESKEARKEGAHIKCTQRE